MAKNEILGAIVAASVMMGGCTTGSAAKGAANSAVKSHATEASSALQFLQCPAGYALVPGTFICAPATVAPTFQCPVGFANIPTTLICVPPGTRYEPTPGAGGCLSGAAFTPGGNVICLPRNIPIILYSARGPNP